MNVFWVSKIQRMIMWMLLLTLVPLQAAFARDGASDFAAWVRHFKAQAVAHGIQGDFYDQAMAGVTPDMRAIELDRKQPERKNLGFQNYLSKVMSQKRIDDGRAHYAAHARLLGDVENRYNVPAEVVVALWGIETSYGQNTGGFDLVRSLATLAWEGRRADFFGAELIQALKILQAGHIERSAFKGSWAGAMGQNQFMPSSWARYAVDYDGDGSKDIWTTRSDVFASSANYLHHNKWNPNLKWGWRVVGVSSNYNKKSATYSDWLNRGVKFEGLAPRIPAQTPLTLIVPDGGGGRMYLVTQNFDVIKTWNRSNYFALTVGLLSDFIATGVQDKSARSSPHYNNP